MTETLSPPGGDEAKRSREIKLGSDFADGVNTAFANEPWGRQIPPPPDYTWNSPTDPPPIGHQLIAFVEGPDDKPVHFDIAYSVKGIGNGQYQIVANVTLKADVTKEDVGRGQFTLPGTFSLAELERDGGAVNKLKDELIRQMIGSSAGGMMQPQPQPPFGFQP